MRLLPIILASFAIAASATLASAATSGEGAPNTEISPSATAPDPNPPDEEGPLPSPEEQLYFAREELLVTGASKRPVRADEAPANVTVITHEDIIQSGVQNLGEIFRRVPGMDVVQVSQSETEVSARGFADSPIDGGAAALAGPGGDSFDDLRVARPPDGPVTVDLRRAWPGVPHLEHDPALTQRNPDQERQGRVRVGVPRDDEVVGHTASVAGRGSRRPAHSPDTDPGPQVRVGLPPDRHTPAG